MEAGHGLQIVSTTNNHSFVLEEAELAQQLLREDIKDLPVVVVSVAGAYRGGKSFLLNFFIRYLSSTASAREDGSWLGDDSAPLVGFKWRSGIKATTMGVLMWSEPFITTLPSGEKVAILLVDTQGTFDNKSDFRENSIIFALSTLISSIQIYNLSHDIREDDLQHLELFTEYGKLVRTGDSNHRAFQVLEFLVRDWQFPEDYSYGIDGGDKLLKEKLEISADLPLETKKIREHITSSFEKLSCFLMPHPGFNVLKATFSGEISDIDPEFKTYLKVFIKSIFSQDKLLPKTINGERIKARDLFNYFKTYMDLFNSSNIPTPTNILAATVKAGLLSAVSEAHDVYEKGMNAECGPKERSVPTVDLKFLHEKYAALARDTYKNKKKMGSEKEINDYLQTLTKDLEARLPQYLQSNLSKIQTAVAAAQDAYDREFQVVSKGHSLCLHPLDLEKTHNDAVKAATLVYDSARKRVTQQYEDERATFIQGFQKNFDLQKQINKQNNNFAVNVISMEYWQKMQTKAMFSPPLSDFEFRNQHQMELEKSLQDFDAKRNIPNHYAEDIYKNDLTERIGAKFDELRKLNLHRIEQIREEEERRAEEQRREEEARWRRIRDQRRREEQRKAEESWRREQERRRQSEERRRNRGPCSVL